MTSEYIVFKGINQELGEYQRKIIKLYLFCVVVLSLERRSLKTESL